MSRLILSEVWKGESASITVAIFGVCARLARCCVELHYGTDYYEQRGEVVTSRSHGSKISGWQQTKNSLKQRIRTVSNLIDLIQFQLKFVKCWRNFRGLNPKGPYLSLDMERKNIVVFTDYIKQAREIRTFHVAVVQRRLRNVQKSVIHEQSCCFAKMNLLLFNCSRCRRSCFNSLLLWSRNFATMVTWRHTSPL